MSIFTLRYIYIQKTIGYEIERKKKNNKNWFYFKMACNSKNKNNKKQNTLLYKIKKHKTHLSTWQTTMLPVNRRRWMDMQAYWWEQKKSEHVF